MTEHKFIFSENELNENTDRGRVRRDLSEGTDLFDSIPGERGARVDDLTSETFYPSSS